MKEKNLAFAIGLNLLLPGLGYIYAGRWIVGILGMLLVVGIYASTGLLYILPTWLMMNAIMAIDMVMLIKKHNKAAESASLRKCPNCAEMVKRDAKVCRFCRSELTTPA